MKINPAGAALALLALSRTAQADDGSLEGLLNESVVTSASHTAETSDNAPATAVTLSSEDLRTYGIRTVEEAIDFLAIGVSTSGGVSSFGVSDLGARGVVLAGDARNHFLLMIDGHAMNEPYAGGQTVDRAAGIPVEMIDHVEIIVGPGSVLYGSNAMLGVINVVTKDATHLRGGHVVVDTQVLSGGRVAALAGIPFRVLGTPGGVTVGLQYLRDLGSDFRVGPQNIGRDAFTERPGRTSRTGAEDGISGGRIVEAGDFAEIPSGVLRATLGNFELGAMGSIARQGIPFNATDFDAPESGIETRRLALDLRHRALVTPSLEVTTRLFADSTDSTFTTVQSRTEGCPFVGVSTCKYLGENASRWAGGELRASYDWLGDGALGTLLGVEGRLRDIRARTNSTNFTTGAFIAESTNVISQQDALLGAYLQQTWTPNNVVGFNAGARLDQLPEYDPVVSPRAAATLHAWPGSAFRVMYSEAFRAPSIAEQEGYSNTRPRAVDLRAEKVRSAEASVGQTLGAHRLFFGVFRTWWTDLVRSQTLTYDEAVEATRQGRLEAVSERFAFEEFRNVSSIDSYGYNFSYDGKSFAQKLRYGLNFTGAHVRQKDPVRAAELLPVAPTYFGNARVAYDFGAPWPTVGLITHLLSERISSRGTLANFDPVPFAPLTLRARLTLSGPVPLARGLSYKASVDVVTAERGPYVIGPTQVGTPTQPKAERDPLERLRVLVGLQYDFLDDAPKPAL